MMQYIQRLQTGVPNRSGARGGGETQDPRKHLGFLSYGRQKVRQKVGRRSWMAKWAKERFGPNLAKIPWPDLVRPRYCLNSMFASCFTRI